MRRAQQKWAAMTFRRKQQAEGIWVEGLRIADGSVLPRITTGNTTAPCVVIGERVAEILGSHYRFASLEADENKEFA